MPVYGNIPQDILSNPGTNAYSTMIKEIATITIQVESLLYQKINPSKIAVIYHHDDYGILLEQYFTSRNIPFSSRRKARLSAQPFIRKIIRLMQYIRTELELPFSGGDLLFEILHFDFYKIPPPDIARLAVEANSRKHSKAPTAMRKLLLEKVNAPAKDLFDTGVNQNLKELSLLLEKLIKKAFDHNLSILFEDILMDAKVPDYIDKSSDRAWLMQLLHSFRDFVNTAIARNPQLQLNELLDLMAVMDREALPSLLNSDPRNPGNVHLLPMEAENLCDYDHVFVGGTNNLPAENINAGLVAAGKVLVTQDNRKEFAKGNEIIQRPEIEHLEESFITPILKKFVMNVSALNNYLHCPLNFYYKNIIRIPAGRKEAMEFGSAVHYALEQLFKKMSATYTGGTFAHKQYEFPAVSVMVEDFNNYMLSHRGSFTEEAFHRRLLYGIEILQNYYNHYINSWNKVVSLERNIGGITVNGVPVKGKPDKLEFNGKEVNIVDYKTGNIDKALLKMQPPDENNPVGGDYWRQAVFYTMLVDNYSKKNWKVASAVIDFIEPDKNKSYRKEKIMVSAADITTVTQQLTEVWNLVKDRRFYTGCGKPDCHWCNFVKDNQLAIALH